MKHLFLLGVILLTGCAANPSFEKSRQEMLSVLQQTQICCRTISELPFRRITRLPYETSRMSASDFEIINSASPVIEIDGQKSYVMALDLPETNLKRTLEFWSISTVSHIRKGGYFSPLVRTYDEHFNLVGKFGGFKFDSTDSIGLQKAGIHGYVPITVETRYVIFYTDEVELNGKTYFLRPGERSYPVTSKEELNDPSLVVKPHLPEGAFLMKITKD